MALTHVGTSPPTFDGGYWPGTKVTAEVPAGAVEGDWAILFAVVKQYMQDFDPATFGSWVHVRSEVLGIFNGSPGPGSGEVRLGIFRRQIPAEGINDTKTIGLINNPTYNQGPSTGGVISIWRSTGGDIEFAGAVAEDSTTVTAHSITFDVDPGLQAGDSVMLVTGYRDDNVRINSASLSAPGATFSALTEIVDFGSTIGDDISMAVHVGQVTAGTATGPATLDGTVSASAGGAGGTILIRIREVGGGAPEPATGTGTGSCSFVGAASGTAPEVPAAEGSGAGAFTFTGSGSGSAPIVPVAEGSGSGTFVFAGSASGAAPAIPASEGSAAGSFTFTGTGQGATQRRGTGSGTVTYAGTATGRRTPKASGSGAYAFSGTAAGRTSRAGSSTGAVAWAGTAVGNAPQVGISEGAAAGSWVFTGAGSGRRAPLGSGSGLTTWAGAGGGTAPLIAPAEGSGSGTVAWTGAAIGGLQRVGHTYAYATLISDGTSAVTLTGDGTSTVSVAPALGTVALVGDGTSIATIDLD